MRKVAGFQLFQATLDCQYIREFDVYFCIGFIELSAFDVILCWVRLVQVLV